MRANPQAFPLSSVRQGCARRPRSPRLELFRWQGRWALSGLLAIAIASLTPTAARAAEVLSMRFGPFEQTVRISDLDTFVETGEVPDSLTKMRRLLTPQVRATLSQRLYVDPSVADSFLTQLLDSHDGEILVEQLLAALPDSDIDGLKAALYRTLHNANGLSVLGFLHAYPQHSLTIDAAAAANLALQLNLAQLQSRLLNPLLRRHLAVPETATERLLPSFNPSQRGLQQVRQRSIVLNDRRRQRRIPVDLYYTRHANGPLVVMSHGFAADRRFLAYLAEHLASYGYSVAALEHPGSNIDVLAEISLNLSPQDVLPAAEFLDRPQDVSFLLDELERLSQDWGYLRDKFNTREVVAIGHSLGGYTALALAGGELNLRELRSFCQRRRPLGRAPADWLQCAAGELPHSQLRLRDRRVKRVIALNPLIGNLFGAEGLRKVATPALIFSSSNDAIAPPLDHQLRPFANLRGEKYLVAAVGTTHMSATDIANLDSIVGQSTLMQEVMGPEAQPARELMQGLSLAFVSQLTPQAPIYRPFLTPAYVQSQSSEAIALRLTSDLPRSLEMTMNALYASEQRLVYAPPPDSETLLGRADQQLARFKRWLLPPQYCVGQLDRIFNSMPRSSGWRG